MKCRVKEAFVILAKLVWARLGHQTLVIRVMLVQLPRKVAFVFSATRESFLTLAELVKHALRGMSPRRHKMSVSRATEVSFQKEESLAAYAWLVTTLQAPDLTNACHVLRDTTPIPLAPSAHLVRLASALLPVVRVHVAFQEQQRGREDCATLVLPITEEQNL